MSNYFNSKIKTGLFDYENEIAKYFHNEIQGIDKVKVYGQENLLFYIVTYHIKWVKTSCTYSTW